VGREMVVWGVEFVVVVVVVVVICKIAVISGFASSKGGFLLSFCMMTIYKRWGFLWFAKERPRE
jgi:hypothetical protein